VKINGIAQHATESSGDALDFQLFALKKKDKRKGGKKINRDVQRQFCDDVGLS
jgi:hypothetical protein